MLGSKESPVVEPITFTETAHDTLFVDNIVLPSETDPVT